MEEFQMHNGYVRTPHLSSYLLPTSMDIPEIIPILLEYPDPLGPFGARGFAELPMVPFAPAVAIAIHDAVGVWLSQQPMTPARVLHALQEVQS